MGGLKDVSATCWALALGARSAEVTINENAIACIFFFIRNSHAERIRDA